MGREVEECLYRKNDSLARLIKEVASVQRRQANSALSKANGRAGVFSQHAREIATFTREKERKSRSRWQAKHLTAPEAAEPTAEVNKGKGSY